MVCAPWARRRAGYSPVDVAATIPGLASTLSTSTAPKSTQTGALSGSPQGPAKAEAGKASAASATTSALTGTGCSKGGGPWPVIFMVPLRAEGSKAARPGFAGPRSLPSEEDRHGAEGAGSSSVFVERRLDLGRLLGFAGLVRRGRVRTGRAAEVQAERLEVDPVAVAADLLQRGEQLLLGGRPRVRGRGHLRGGADLDPAVPLQPRGRRDELPDDHVLLQAEQPVDLALDRRVGQHLRRLLEGRRREERLRRERRLRDPEDQRLEGRLLLLALLLLYAEVLALEHDLVHQLAGQQVGVAGVVDAHLLQHLPHDQLDVLVVDVDALGAVHLLHLADEVELGLGRGPARVRV